MITEITNSEILERLRSLLEELEKPCNEECQEFDCYGCKVKADIEILRKRLGELR